VAVPAGSHTSQPDLIAGYRASDKTGSSCNYFVTGENNKVVYSIPDDTDRKVLFLDSYHLVYEKVCLRGGRKNCSIIHY
jgi:hypothetical protein